MPDFNARTDRGLAHNVPCRGALNKVACNRTPKRGEARSLHHRITAQLMVKPQ